MTQTHTDSTDHHREVPIMGKGSTTHSSKPTFRTGNIVTPASPRVTARQGTSVKIGRDDAPEWGLARPQSMTTNSPIVGYAVKVPRQNLATDIARKADDRPAEPIRDAVLATETMPAHEVWTEGKGKAAREHRRAMRTLDLSDAPLPVLPRRAEPVTQPHTDSKPDGKAGKRADREARAAVKAERDQAILTYLRTIGYQGSLTSDIRVLALDAMEQARQDAEYARH